MSQKRIGLLCHRSPDNSINLAPAYAKWCNRYGMIVPIYALDPIVNTSIDVLVMIGGADVDPRRYQAADAEIDYYTQNPNIQLEWFDTVVMPKYIDNGIGIMGICRGFQSLNIHFGGILSQNIAQYYSNPRDEIKDHQRRTDRGRTWCHENGFNEVFDKKSGTFGVNSLHHQGFYEEQTAPALLPILVNKDFKNVEAITYPGRKIFGVQYHPEEIYDEFSDLIMQKILYED